MKARLFFIGIWNFADDCGNIQNISKQLKAKIFPFDNIDVAPLIKELSTTGLLREYSCNGDNFLNISGFLKHQLINHPSKPQCPPYSSGSTPVVLPPDLSGSEGIGLEGKGVEAEAAWRTNFEIYEKEVSDAFDALLKDSDWLSERQRYHPNLDLALSMEKAYNDFWGTEAGWEHKKSKRIKTIDWKATFSNALTLKSNQVFLKRKKEEDYAR